ncbi:MAG: hypothetical protein ACHQYQ_10395 [Bacteriovoracales bacterium]
MRGINLVMPGHHTLKFNGVRPKFLGIHAQWRLQFFYQFVNYCGLLGHCPRLTLQLPKESDSLEAALFFNCPPGSYSKDLAETICENINSQSGKFFEVAFDLNPKLIWMREIQIKGGK